MAKKKWKKLLKKAGKAALIGGALYAGAKALKGRSLKGNASKLTEGDIGIGQSAILKRNKAIDAGIGAAEADKGSEMYIQKRKSPPVLDPHRFRWPMNTANARSTALYKKGGSVKKANVTGIAKRGFGRALMKK